MAVYPEHVTTALVEIADQAHGAKLGIRTFDALRERCLGDTAQSGQLR